MEDIVVYLHSSGSTGLPRAIPQRQINVLHWCKSDVLLEWRHMDILWGVMPLPTFHTFAFMMQLYAPLVNGRPVGLYPPRAPAPPPVPSPKNVLDACRALRCNAIAIVPAFIEAWAKSDEDVAYLASLRLLGYAGGPLSAETGSRLYDAGVTLCAGYGATEFGNHVRLLDADDSQGPDAPVKTRADWQWFTFSSYVSPRWVPQGDGTYELQFLTCPTHRPSVENLPDTRGYATNDLWIPHPSKPGLWKIVGRKDDVIVLGAGEKVVPLTQESVLLAHPAVTGAVMFGRGKAQCGVLVEVGPGYEGDPRDPAYADRLRDAIWPAVQEANMKAPAFARIFKEMILIADSAKPLPRAAKSTVIRKQALDLYEAEIEELYDSVKENVASDGTPGPSSWSAQDIEFWLVELCADIKDGARISPSADLFNQGFDSLHGAALRTRILSALRVSPEPTAQDAARQISQNFIFTHPTLHELSAALSQLVFGGEDSARRSAVQDITHMLDTYARDLPLVSRAHTPTTSTGAVVLITGSTGNVGSHMLATLLQEPRVARVYTLNRPAPAAHDRQRRVFAERGLPVALLASAKLVPLSGNATDARLGLAPAAFDE
ncbi:acetyl-CoA synthetase-like protein, partial [Phanerochaete sordida]